MNLIHSNVNGLGDALLPSRWWPLRKRYTHQSEGLQTHDVFCIMLCFLRVTVFLLCHSLYLSAVLDVMLVSNKLFQVQSSKFKYVAVRGLYGPLTVPAWTVHGLFTIYKPVRGP